MAEYQEEEQVSDKSPPDTDTDAGDPADTGYGSDDDILTQARKEFKLCQDAESVNRNDAKDDLLFLTGGENQWDPRAVSARRADGRPIITVNDLPVMLHQVTNDQRQNTPSIKVHPVDDTADIETARVVQGMIRHIEYDSNADVAYDRAVNSAAAIGFGFWYLDTEYEDGSSFNQKIVYRSVRNHLAVHIDPMAIEPDGSDMNFAFIEQLMAREAFKKEYPKAKANDQSAFQGNSDYSGWLSDQTVLVCRYYCVKREKAEAVLLSNGEEGFADKLLEMPQGVTVIKRRPGERRRVMLYKITGVDILERTEILCKWIPVFPVYGDEIDIEGKVVRSGIVRNAKGPAQAYNVFMSGATEEVSLRTKSPYIGAEGQFEGYEDDWNQANNRAFPFLEYKPTALDGKLAPPPQRQAMADIPSGMLAMAMHAQDNKKKTTGLFDASLGARGTATSGKQEIAQQREGDMANFHYADGLLRSLRHCGRCIVNMIPNYYDTRRTVRMLGEDGKTLTAAVINDPQMVQKEGGAIATVLNNLTVGEFDVTVSAGPSYSTMRQENAEFFTNAMQAAKDPATAAVVTYLAMKNQDAPGADIATKMIATLLPPSAKAVLDEENNEDDEAPQVVQTAKGPLPVAQVPQVLMALEQQLQAAGEAVEKSQADKNQAEVLRQQNAEKELEVKQRDANTKAFEADTARQEMERQKDVDIAKANAEAEKYREEQLRAEADVIRAASENIRAQMERDAPKDATGQPQDVPSLEDIAQLIIQSRQPISGMAITAPSGQTYSVKVM